MECSQRGVPLCTAYALPKYVIMSWVHYTREFQRFIFYTVNLKLVEKPPQSLPGQHRHILKLERTTMYTTHQFLEVGIECKVQDELCIIEGPELLDDSWPHVVVVYRGEEVAQETAHVVVELITRADGVALTLHRHGQGASLKEKIHCV